MSYVNDPNDPDYVVPNTVPPIAEAVEPAPNPLKWLWWLLGLLVLAALIWTLVRACQPHENCTSLPSTLWTQSHQDTVWSTLEGYDAEHFTTANRGAVISELQALCNRRLGGHTLSVNDISGSAAFTGVADAGRVLSLINGTAFCRCS